MLRSIAILLLVGACSDDRYTECPEEQGLVVIHTGVFGLIWQGCDVNPPCAPYRSNALVAAFAPRMPGEIPPVGDAIAAMRSDEHGLFQLQLEPGDYDLCLVPVGSQDLRCARITVAELPIRYDFAFDPYPGYYWTPAHCE